MLTAETGGLEKAFRAMDEVVEVDRRTGGLETAIKKNSNNRDC